MHLTFIIFGTVIAGHALQVKTPMERVAVRTGIYLSATLEVYAICEVKSTQNTTNSEGRGAITLYKHTVQTL